MTQNINLFDPGSRKPRPRLSFVKLLSGLAATVAVLLAVHVFLEFQVTGMHGELRRGLEALNDGRAELQKHAGQAAARKPDPQLEIEIGKLQLELRQAHEAVAALNASSFGEGRGFAEYLRAFSRQSLEGLWLTAFTINGKELELRGRALRPDLVPAYIQRLNDEDVLAGRSFARLEMNRPEAQPAADKKPPQVASFLEFSLATREAVKNVEKAQ
jgi:type IV pilus assembly PilN-like protein